MLAPLSVNLRQRVSAAHQAKQRFQRQLAQQNKKLVCLLSQT
jgi:hypothetical protein